MQLPRRFATAGASAFIALALSLLAIASPARANTVDWINSAGGSALDSSNWFDNDTYTFHTPTNDDFARFIINGGFNVQWGAPVDTLFEVDAEAGQPRFNINGTLTLFLGIGVNTDSLTLLSGNVTANAMSVGWSSASTFLGTGGSLILCTDSTQGSRWGYGGRARVTLTGGGTILSNGWIEMAHGIADHCTTTVIGRNGPFGNSSGLITQSAVGGGYRGDVIVGTNGTGCLQISNGGYANIAGDLMIAKGNQAAGMVHVYNTPGGVFAPSLTVHGQTVLGNQDPTQYLSGWGELLAERGSTNLMGPCLVQNGQITVRNGASLTATDVALDSSPNDAGAGFNVRGTGSHATITSSLHVGGANMPGSLINISFLVDTNATVSYTGSSPLSVYQNGALYVSNGSSLQSSADVEVWGEARMNSLVQAPRVHVMGRYFSELSTYTNAVIKARILVDGPGSLLRINGPGFLSTIGDSTATDGFVSTGETQLESDTLLVLDKDGADLGFVALGNGTLRVPSGGHLANGMYLYAPGRFEGNLTNEGTISIPSSYILTVAGHLTQLTGLAIGDGGLLIPAGSVLSARGSIDPLILLSGSLDFGPSPSLLSAGHGMQVMSTAAMTFRLGRKSSGIQDAMFVTGTATLGGKLDVRPIIGNLPNAGDTITILTASTVSGTFSSVKYNGGNPAGAITVLYSPTSVRIVVINGTLAVNGGDAPGQPLRFACSGTLHAPAMALDLPSPSNVKVALYDVAGRQVAVLADGSLAAGRHQMALANSGVSSGVYFGRAMVTDPSGTHALTARVVLLR